MDGFTVLSSTASTRQLGYWIGNRNTNSENWSIRIEKIQRRLRIATTITNSVAQRVTLLNAIALPAILFTGKQFIPSRNNLRKLVNLQKQFVWNGKASTETTKHKLNPALVYTQRDQGGLGLQDISLALRATRSNLAERWLQAKPDIYSVAWHAMAHPGEEPSQLCCQFRPTSARMLSLCAKESRRQPQISVQLLGKLELWNSQSIKMIPKNDQLKKIQQMIISAPATRSCYWISGTQLRFITAMTNDCDIPDKYANFLLESPWHDNANVTDKNGHPLRLQNFPSLRPARIRDIVFTIENLSPMQSDKAAVLQPPLHKQPYTQRHSRQIVRWCSCVMLSLPWKIWTVKPQTLQPRNLPHMQHDLEWTYGEADDTITAKVKSGESSNLDIQLQRNQDGWTWSIMKASASYQKTYDYEELVAWINREGLAFKQTPQTALYPWSAPELTKSANLGITIRKQRTKVLKTQLRYSLQPTLEKIKRKKSASAWQSAALQQTVYQLWSTQGIFYRLPKLDNVSYRSWSSQLAPR